jgi:hypothetical protein
MNRRSPLLALRVILRRRSNSVAPAAKRTFSERRSPNRIYEYAPQSLKGVSNRNLPADLHLGNAALAKPALASTSPASMV